MEINSGCDCVIFNSNVGNPPVYSGLYTLRFITPSRRLRGSLQRPKRSSIRFGGNRVFKGPGLCGTARRQRSCPDICHLYNSAFSGKHTPTRYSRGNIACFLLYLVCRWDLCTLAIRCVPAQCNNPSFIPGARSGRGNFAANPPFLFSFWNCRNNQKGSNSFLKYLFGD